MRQGSASLGSSLIVESVGEIVPLELWLDLECGVGQGPYFVKKLIESIEEAVSEVAAVNLEEGLDDPTNTFASTSEGGSDARNSAISGVLFREPPTPELLSLFDHVPTVRC